MAWIGVAFDPVFPATNAFGRAITTLSTLWQGAINLVEHGVINIRSERTFDGFEVSPVPVAGQLNAVHDPRRHIIDKPLRAFAVATADEVGNEQFRIGLDCRPSPGIASTINRIFHRGHVFLFCAGERPEFVNLNATRLHVANLRIMKARTEAPGVLQEF
jgi:hypothetical protein